MKILYICLCCVLLTEKINAEKIAIINTHEIFQKIMHLQKIDKNIEKELEQNKQELKNIEEKLKHKANIIQKNSLNKNYDIIEKFKIDQKNFIEKIKQFENKNKIFQKEKIKKTLKYIEHKTKIIAQQKKYDIICDKNSILYIKNNLNLDNITEIFIKDFNKK